MKRVVILGGGFGGVRCALDLNRLLADRKDIAIILIDQNNRHTFTPWLYAVATAQLAGEKLVRLAIEEIATISYAEIFSGTRVQFVEATVTGIDLAARRIQMGEQTISFELIVIGVGATMNTFGIPGLAEYAVSFQTMAHAITIRNRLNVLVSAPRPATVIVVGAGPSGIELICELARLMPSLVRAKGRHPDHIRLCLLEACPAILPGFASHVVAYVQDRLQRLSVNVLTNNRLERVELSRVMVRVGDVEQSLNYDLLIWTGGVQANTLTANLPAVSHDPKGRLVTDSSLRVPPFDYVWAFGDCAAITPRRAHHPLPELAPLAIEAGRIAARNVAAFFQGRPPLAEMSAHRLIIILPLGGRHTLVITPRFILTGLNAWATHFLVDVRYWMSLVSFPRAFGRGWRMVRFWIC